MKLTKISILRMMVLTLFISYTYQLDAQESCSQSLKKAEEFFKNGQNEKVRPLLETCLSSNGFKKSEKTKAYRLLTLSNLYDAEDNAAIESMRKLLKTMPEYEIDLIEDPAEFISLYETFKTDPAAIIGVKGGIGAFNLYDITYFNDISGENDTISYTPHISFHGGIHAEIPIKSFISVSIGGNYTKYSYSYKRDILAFSDIAYSESVHLISVPLMVQINLLKKTKIKLSDDEDKKAREVKRDFMPYVSLGATGSYIVSSQVSDVTRTDAKIGEETKIISNNSQAIIVTDSRNRLNYALTAGIGFRLKNVIANGYFTFDIRYSRFFENLVDRSNRFSNDELTYNYLHTDNEFKFEDISVLIGYSLPLYRAKQYKKFRK